MKRLVLLVCSPEEGETFVIGAWEAGILDTMGEADVEDQFLYVIETWAPTIPRDAFRTVIVNVPEDDLLRAFVHVETTATVQGAGDAV